MMKRISMRLSDCTGEPEINQTCVSLEFYSYSPLFGAEWIQTIHAQIPEEIEKLFKDDSCQNLTSTVCSLCPHAPLSLLSLTTLELISLVLKLLDPPSFNPPLHSTPFQPNPSPSLDRFITRHESSFPNLHYTPTDLPIES